MKVQSDRDGLEELLKEVWVAIEPEDVLPTDGPYDFALAIEGEDYDQLESTVERIQSMPHVYGIKTHIGVIGPDWIRLSADSEEE